MPYWVNYLKRLFKNYHKRQEENNINEYYASKGRPVTKPILTQEDFDKIILHYEKPLGLYVFSTNKKFTDSIISNYSFGGGCINDTVVQFNNSRLPFGGVGHSGIGAYHGSRSFDVFSHQKSIVHKGNWLDIPLRYAPYGNKIKWIKKVLKWI